MTVPAVTPSVTAVRRGRVGISTAFFTQGLVFAVVLTHLGAFKERWDIDDLAIAIIMFAVAILAAGGSACAALLAARWGSAAALRTGLAGLAIAAVGAAVAPTFVAFCAALGGYGLALGCVDATSNMQAVACEAVQGRSILTSFHGAWSAGGIVGALETSGTAALDWPLAPSLGVAAIIPLLAVFAPLLPQVTGRGSADKEPEETMPIPWRPLAAAGTAIVLFYIADSATQSWSTIYLHDVLLAADSVAPLGYAAYQTTSLLSRIAGDHLVRRLGAATVVRFAAVVGAIGLLAAVLAPRAVVAIVGFAVLGVGIAVVAPLSFAAAGHLAERDRAGSRITDAAVRRRQADRIIARVNQFNYLGFVLGGVVTGFVASGSGMRIGFLVPLVGIIGIIPLARVFGRRRAVRQDHHL